MLIIAPGQSSAIEMDRIAKCASKDDVITISINYDYDEGLTDFIFLSNLRRYRDLPPEKKGKSIVTSNIPAVDVYLQVKYKDLLNDVDAVQDNAGLMLIKFLISQGIKKVLIAGMDGYSPNPYENYADQRMSFYSGKELAEKKNLGMIDVLKEYQKQIEIEFLTTPKYVTIN